MQQFSRRAVLAILASAAGAALVGLSMEEVEAMANVQIKTLDIQLYGSASTLVSASAVPVGAVEISQTSTSVRLIFVINPLDPTVTRTFKFHSPNNGTWDDSLERVVAVTQLRTATGAYLPAVITEVL